MLIPWPEFYFVQNNPGQNEVELRCADSLMGCIPRGHLVGAAFEPPMIQGKSILIPQQYLHAPAGGTKENKQLATERVFAQFVTDQSAQAVDTFAHVGATLIQIASVKAGDGQHESASDRDQFTDGSPSNNTRTPDGKITSQRQDAASLTWSSEKPDEGLVPKRLCQ